MSNEKESTAERKHHAYSPSKLQMLESCPKYQSTFTESEAAATGTKQHNVADSGEDDATLPDFKAMAVVECMKFVDERRALYPGHTFLREDYVPIDDEKIIGPDGTVFEGTTAGYFDAAIISADGKTCEVTDYKFGKNAVETASNNLQGMAYVLGLYKRFPTIERANVFFILPHRDEIEGCEFVRDQFDGFRLRIRTVVQRAIEANKDANDFSTATPNQSACLFCDAVGRCPKVAAVALKVGKKYAPLEIPDSISTTVFTDPVQIAQGLKLAAIIKTWAEAYRSQATAKTIDSPDFIPEGYSLVPSQRRNVVKAKALGELAKTFLPEDTREKVEALYDVSIGALEKLISTAAPRGQKEKSVEAFGEAAIVNGCIELGTPFAFLKQSTKKA